MNSNVIFFSVVPVFFYDGQPIFSSKMVRVRIGRSKPSGGLAEVDNQTVIADENYVWTYTSPDFPMRQVSPRLGFPTQPPPTGLSVIDQPCLRQQDTALHSYIIVSVMITDS